jgi:hypothetical protein
MQRRIHRQLVFGPLDRGQRRADRIHFLTLVKGLAADEEMGDAARFELVHVIARDVVAEVQEAAEQEADVAGLDLFSLASNRNRPRALR